jgi:hypothetical protein
MRTHLLGRWISCSVTLFALAAGMSLTQAWAQGPGPGNREGRGDRDPGRFEERGGPGMRSEARTKRAIRSAEDRSDAFKKLVDKALDRSRLNGTRREDRINDKVGDLSKALDQLRRKFERRESIRDTRSEATKALDEARAVNRIMLNLRGTPKVHQQWTLLRDDMDQLARIYSLRPVNAPFFPGNRDRNQDRNRDRDSGHSDDHEGPGPR